MSTLSSSLTASASTTLADFYLPATGGARPAGHYLAVARRATMVWGAVQVAVALAAIPVSQSIVDEVLGISSFTNGLILGVFLLGLAGYRRNATAYVGITVGAAAMLAVRLLTSVSWQWYVLIGAAVDDGGGMDGRPQRRDEGCRRWIGAPPSPPSRGSSTTRCAGAPFRAPPWRSAAAPARSGVMPPAPCPTTTRPSRQRPTRSSISRP